MHALVSINGAIPFSVILIECPDTGVYGCAGRIVDLNNHRSAFRFVWAPGTAASVIREHTVISYPLIGGLDLRGKHQKTENGNEKQDSSFKHFYHPLFDVYMNYTPLEIKSQKVAQYDFFEAGETTFEDKILYIKISCMQKGENIMGNKDTVNISSSKARMTLNGIYRIGAAIGTTIVSSTKSVANIVMNERNKYNSLKKINEEANVKMTESVEKYSQTCIVLKTELENLKEITNEIYDSFEDIGISFDEEKYKNIPEIVPSVENAVTMGSVLSGIAVGSLLSGSAVFLTASFCTAGTGTAISSLTGVYAVNAILAALGGGTIAAGGFGVAGGVAVVSGLFVIPALVVGATVTHKKLQEWEKKTFKSIKKIEGTIEENNKLSKRNLNAAKNIRKLYELGIGIKLILSLYKRSSDRGKEITKVIKDKLGKAFFGIELFSGQEINPDTDFLVQEINADVTFLNEIFSSNKNVEKYTEKSFTDIFPKIYDDAQEFLYLSYPWYNEHWVKEDLDKMKRAAFRGVEITICFGMGKDTESNKTLQKSKEAVDIIWQNIPSDISNIHIIQIDSHMKIAICEKYVLYGSQNAMTYRYDAYAIEIGDIRSEVTVKDTDPEMIRYFKNLIEEKISEKIRKTK
nr:MAG TPA: hypothetical protein [Caudoviricetes sp.]